MRTAFLCLVICLGGLACEQETINIYNFGNRGGDVSTMMDMQVLPEVSVDDCGVSEDATVDLSEGDSLVGVDTVLEDLSDGEDSLGSGCFVSELHSTLRVPADCATIQQAVDVAVSAGWDSDHYSSIQVVILIAPGVYHESVVISGIANVFITTDGDGEVVIDGGLGSAIASDTFGGLRVALWKLTLKSVNVSRSATMFMGFGAVAELNAVTIYTNSIGLMVREVADVRVANSKFIGSGSMESTGIYWSHSNSGSSVCGCSFESLGLAIYQCSGSGPELSPVYDDGQDSNSYDSVGLRYYLDPDCE